MQQLGFRPTRHVIKGGDAQRMDAVADGAVHLVITSPPYPMIEMWDGIFAERSQAVKRALETAEPWTAFEAMHKLLDTVWAECARVLAPGGFLCINIGDATRTVGENFSIYPNHARILSACVALGLQPVPAVIWRKQTNAPNKFMGSGMLPAGAYVTLEHEFILVLRKGGKRAFSDAERNMRRRSAMFWEERNQWFSDLWDFKGERQDLGDPEITRRSAAFPLELAYRIVAMYSIEGDTVLDPFAGTGTTAIASGMLGRNSIGYEIESRVAALARSRISGCGEEARTRSAARLAAHLAFVDERKAKGKELAHENEFYKFPVVTSQEVALCIPEIMDVTTEGDTRIATYRFARPPPRLILEAEPAVPMRSLTAWTQ